jgi:hypothetical protein
MKKRRVATTTTSTLETQPVTLVLHMREGPPQVIHGNSGMAGVFCHLRAVWVPVEPDPDSDAEMKLVFCRDIAWIEVFKQEDYDAV